ncbi:TSUP family transporter [Sporosarcina sp. Te-1]|uniref:sulfite exporter TauE/SafE family protein n=1 Tax=Sporosarcina sp. Te-1 TaxID=2818390 RepID=UPI001A9FAD53|nr:TSUP family transporter [Sporosarcina sp. Te-1]QTD42035.1 TSUP family transporter [Sporosarcina sp. Te-1]
MKKQWMICLLLSMALLLLFAFTLHYQLMILYMIAICSSFVGTLAGGGGLVTLPAMMLTGIPIQTSIATNKFSSGVAAFSSVYYLLRQKQLNMKRMIQTVFIAFLGGMGGACVTTHLSDKTMNITAIILLIIALVVTVNNTGWIGTAQSYESETKNRLTPFLLLSIAAYDGGFGPGSSTFSILYYMNKQQTYVKAVQLTRVLIFGSCTGAFIIFHQTGYLQWPYAIVMAVGSIIGSQLGLVVLPKVSLKVAKSLLLTITCLLIIQMMSKIF